MSLAGRRNWRYRVGIAIGKRVGRYNLATGCHWYPPSMLSTKRHAYNRTSWLYKKYIG